MKKMNKYKILIVEDDILMQKMLKDSMKESGFSITLASDGRAGLVKFQKTYFDLVLLDIKLPKMNGIELLKKIKEISDEVIVIMMTAFGAVDTAVDAIKMGAFDYVTKPFLPEELILIMQKGLELFRRHT